MDAEVPPNKYGHRGPLPNKSMDAEVPQKGMDAEVPPEEPHKKYGRRDTASLGLYLGHVYIYIGIYTYLHTYIYIHITYI